MLAEVVDRLVSAPLPYWVLWAWWAVAAGWLLDWRWRESPRDDDHLSGRRGLGAVLGVALVLAVSLYFTGVADTPILFAS
jgi:hypothetical protein